MAERWLGSQGELRSEKLMRSPTTGTMVERVWTGSEDYIYGIYNQNLNIANEFAEIDDSEAPLFRLTIRTPSTETQISSWELLANSVERDIFEHPKSLKLPADVIRSITKLLDDPGSAVPIVPAWNADANALYELAARGTVKFQVSNYVLRKTQQVASEGGITLDPKTIASQFALAEKLFLGVGKIWENENLILAELVPSTVTFNVLQIPKPTDIPASTHKWGWLKQSPILQQSGRHLWSATSEWWLEAWSTFLYETQPNPAP